jgi:uracil-DNA glycosylase
MEMSTNSSQPATPLQTLLAEIRECRCCATHLPQTPRPVLPILRQQVTRVLST